MGSSELEILEIISSVGQARSLYIEAIQEAKSKNYGQCNELVRKGNEQYAKGHRIHQRLVQEEAGGNPGCYVYCAPFFWRPPTPHVLAALRPP